jgi:hypothetical protein
MTGALMQLVNVGVGDKYLYDEDKSTRYRSHYQKSDKSAAEQIIAEGLRSKDGWRSITVSRVGDMIGDVRLVLKVRREAQQQIDDTTVFSWLDQLKLEVGGKLLESFGGDTLLACSLWNSNCVAYVDLSDPDTTTAVIQLSMFFTDCLAKQLPLICLRFHKVKIRYKLADSIERHVISSQLSIRYTYLDGKARRSMVVGKHDYNVWIKQDMHAKLQTGPCSL